MGYASDHAEWDENGESTGQGYVLNHWKGRHSLGRSYWINLVIVGYVCGGILAVIILGVASSDMALSTIAAILLSALAISTGLWFWGAVGTWRSANRHEGRGGRGFWVAAAKVSIILGGIGTFGQLATLTDENRELSNIVSGDKMLGEQARISNFGDGVALLEGNIKDGLERDFDRILESDRSLHRLQVNSVGGRGLIAERIASKVAQNGLDVDVQGECSSACTLILLAGKNRSAGQGSKIGFHRASFGNSSSAEEKELSSDMRRAYEAAGVARDFIDRALSTPSSEMWYPTENELFEAGVLNHITQEHLEEALAMAAEAANQQLPIQIDEVTWFEKVEVTGTTIIRHYSLTLPASEIDKQFFDRVVAPEVTQSTCAVADAARAVKYGARIEHRYVGSDERLIASLLVDHCEG